MHGHHHLLHALRPAGLAGAVNTVLKASAGAGLALVGVYLLSRSRERLGMETRMARLEAMLQDLEKKPREKKPRGPGTE
jgi:hypothetical protein